MNQQSIRDQSKTFLTDECSYRLADSVHRFNVDRVMFSIPPCHVLHLSDHGTVELSGRH
jgi:hypothetical protein